MYLDTVESQNVHVRFPARRSNGRGGLGTVRHVECVAAKRALPDAVHTSDHVIASPMWW